MSRGKEDQWQRSVCKSKLVSQKYEDQVRRDLHIQRFDSLPILVEALQLADQIQHGADHVRDPMRFMITLMPISIRVYQNIRDGNPDSVILAGFVSSVV